MFPWLELATNLAKKWFSPKLAEHQQRKERKSIIFTSNGPEHFTRKVGQNNTSSTCCRSAALVDQTDDGSLVLEHLVSHAGHSPHALHGLVCRRGHQGCADTFHSLSCRVLSFSGTFPRPQPQYFLKSTAVQIGGVLPHKWEVYRSTNRKCIVGFSFLQGLEARKIQRYKWGVHCHTNWRCIAVLSSRPVGVGVSETLLSFETDEPFGSFGPKIPWEVKKESPGSSGLGEAKIRRSFFSESKISQNDSFWLLFDSSQIFSIPGPENLQRLFSDLFGILGPKDLQLTYACLNLVLFFAPYRAFCCDIAVATCPSISHRLLHGAAPQISSAPAFVRNCLRWGAGPI